MITMKLMKNLVLSEIFVCKEFQKKKLTMIELQQL